jgi:hypothetical protein
MKKLLSINEYFNKINEDKINTDDYFVKRNEAKLKNLLMKNEDFANGRVLYAIVDIIYNYWQKPENKNMTYSNITDYVGKEYGFLPLFCFLLSNYDGQVCNGGHIQYFDNGYASSNTNGYKSSYDDIETHEEFASLFKDLQFDKILANGKAAYDIINSFELNLEDEIDECTECRGSGEVKCDECDGNGNIDCPECDGTGEKDDEDCDNCNGNGNIECDNCNGDGSFTCDECHGRGEASTGRQIPDINHWSNLDSRWYSNNNAFKEELDDYLKTLMLDGEKMSNLIELAENTQKYNM